MRITEKKLRRIIRSVIKESFETESERLNLQGFCGYLDYLGHGLGLSSSTATLDNIAFHWQRFHPDLCDEIYDQMETDRPDLIPTLKRVMSDADQIKTRSGTKGGYSYTQYLGKN